MKTALSIAGSDSSGGAGIQADIKTMIMNGVYAMTAVTALTAQNTMGVSDVLTVMPEFLARQIDAVFTDIRPDAVKIGMVSAPELVEVIAEKLAEYQAENIVVDPVLGATSGASLAQGGTAAALCEKLFPLAAVITPNIPEAEVLAGIQIRSPEDMEQAAKRLGDTYGCAVLLKGGHSVNDANDFLYIPVTDRYDVGTGKEGERSGSPKPGKTGRVNSGKAEQSREEEEKSGSPEPGKTGKANPGKPEQGREEEEKSGSPEPGKMGRVNPGKTEQSREEMRIWFPGRRIDNPNTHGTGCTLSSAIAANLAKGASLPEAVAQAKEYISAALAAGLDLGHGSGPLNHMVTAGARSAEQSAYHF